MLNSQALKAEQQQKAGEAAAQAEPMEPVPVPKVSQKEKKLAKKDLDGTTGCFFWCAE